MQEGPRDIQHRLDGGGDHPQRLRADSVGEPAHRDLEQEGEYRGDGQAEADLAAGQSDDLGEEDGGAGEEGAGAERRQHGLEREVALQRCRGKDPAPPGHGSILR